MLLSAGMTLLSGWNPQGRASRRQAPTVKEKIAHAPLGDKSLRADTLRSTFFLTDTLVIITVRNKNAWEFQLEDYPGR
jgi:hypothetical protein